MIKKIENCLYCGEKMESITAKKKYCSNKCRLYYNRERNVLVVPKQVDNIKPEQVVAKKVEVLESPKNRPNPPINLKGLDLAIWKSENWE
jgi:ribosomal protein L24E